MINIRVEVRNKLLLIFVGILIGMGIMKLGDVLMVEEDFLDFNVEDTLSGNLGISGGEGIIKDYTDKCDTMINNAVIRINVGFDSIIRLPKCDTIVVMKDSIATYIDKCDTSKYDEMIDLIKLLYDYWFMGHKDTCYCLEKAVNIEMDTIDALDLE